MANPNPTIRRGDTGDAVKRLQMLLIAHGFDLGPPPDLGIDGSFGPKTAAALGSFLRGEDMPPSEVVTPEIWNLLFNATNPGEPPWAQVARREIGQREVRGLGDNPRIMNYYVIAGFNPDQTQFEDHDEVPWCEAFRRFCYASAGVPLAGLPRSLMARDALKHGEPVLGTAQAWDHAVWPRGAPGSGQGHVAFVLRDTGDYLIVLGGNQGFDGGPSDAVSVSAIRKAGNLGVRRVRPAATAPAPTPRPTPPAPSPTQPPAEMNLLQRILSWLASLFSGSSKPKE